MWYFDIAKHVNYYNGGFYMQTSKGVALQKAVWFQAWVVSLMKALAYREEFEAGTDWELEAEGGAEAGWGGKAGRKNLISEELNLKYQESSSCRHLNLEA